MAYGFNDDKSKAALANVATSGNYNDLSNKPYWSTMAEQTVQFSNSYLPGNTGITIPDTAQEVIVTVSTSFGDYGQAHLMRGENIHIPTTRVVQGATISTYTGQYWVYFANGKVYVREAYLVWTVLNNGQVQMSRSTISDCRVRVSYR